LPDADAETAETGSSLNPAIKTTDTAATEFAEPGPLVSELASNIANTANVALNTADIGAPNLSTAPLLNLEAGATTDIPIDGQATTEKFSASPTPQMTDDALDLLNSKALQPTSVGQTIASPTNGTASNTPVPPIPENAVPSPSTLTADSALVSQSQAGAVITAGNPRTGSGASTQINGEASPKIALTSGSTDAGDGESDIETIPGPVGKPTATSLTGGQSTQSTVPTTASGPEAQAQASADLGTKTAPALQELPAGKSDAPAQTSASASNHNTALASAFGSELKLAGNVSPTTETAATRNAPNAAASQVAVQINRAVQDGQEKLIVNLKPGNLGKVSVQLEVGHDNRIIAVIAAERPETLELLQRDSRALELALKETGLKTDSGSLSFSLQDNGAEDTPFDNPSGSNDAISVTQGGDDLEELQTLSTKAFTTDASGVDIQV
jgi:flagellar hook-length control protein FliK